jgi:homogentisate 1,2-dioxygenase
VCRGYICEIYNGHYEIPNLGPIGANGLANPRDFKTPVAWYEDIDERHIVTNKYGGRLFVTHLDYSPFNVVAWHGNYYPFKYDLRRFNTVNTVSYDHLDPCIFCVLTCQTAEPGVAVVDFVIFPPRWIVAENTFRPPYYHRNTMSEYMGMVWGKYDAKIDVVEAAGSSKKKKGFFPGGGSLHLCMTPHGPDAGTFEKASDTSVPQKPVYFNEGLAFMFETNRILKIAPSALRSERVEEAYSECWQKLPKLFNGKIDAGRK